MKYKKLMGALTLGALVTVGLAACSSKKEESKTEDKMEDVSKFPIKTSNQKEAKDGGTLNVAVVKDGQIPGLFDRAFSDTTLDIFFMDPSHEPLFTMDSNFETTDDGIAKKEIDVENKKITITIDKKNVKWSDGEDLVAEDLIEPYLIICSPDYAGTRYGQYFINIEGAEDYHAGKADSISGIKKIDDKSIEIHYKEMNPGMKQNSETVWCYAMPSHVLKDIPIKGMESSDAIRKNPVTLGAYKMSKVTQGEAVEYTPNEYYYGDKPKLDKIVMSVTPTASVTEAMKANKFDIFLNMPTATYKTYKDIDGYELLGRQDLTYTYMGFRLGTRDMETGENIYDPNSKMANKSLRQAMGYAMNNKDVADEFYYGLNQAANTVVPPIFNDFSDKDLVGYSKQDVDKANKLLDDAGYKKKEGEEFRRDPDGNELVINFAAKDEGETSEPLAEYYIDAWKEIGLNVQLTGGRLIEFNSFYDKLKSNDPDIDVYQAAWSLSNDPSQTNYYSKTAVFNFTRFVSDKNTELLNDIDSEKAFDNEYRIEAFKKWQEYVEDEAFVIPTLFRDAILPVSEKVTNFNWSYDAINPWASVGLTD